MLEEVNWSQTEAAEKFNVKLSTLNSKIKRLGIYVKRKNARSQIFNHFYFNNKAYLKLIVVIMLYKLKNPSFNIHFDFDRRFITEWES